MRFARAIVNQPGTNHQRASIVRCRNTLGNAIELLATDNRRREFGISRKTGYKIFQAVQGACFRSAERPLSATGALCQSLDRVGWSARRHQGGDEGIWIVSFMQYDLGYIDLEQKTLQPLDNPFGPRLSPMS
jgi:hypothetical protein